MTPTTMRPQRNSISHTGKDPGEKEKQREKDNKLSDFNTTLCSPDDDDDDDRGLTLVGDCVYLTATVHSYTKHSCFIIPFDIFAFQEVRQEGHICHNNAMGLLYIIQPLHTKRVLIIKRTSLVSYRCVPTQSLPVGRK